MAKVTNNNALEYIKKYMNALGIKDKNVTDVDVKSIFESDNIDSNGDGSISKSEFDDALNGYFKNEGYNINDVEQEFLDAWADFAGYDGDANSVSNSDMVNLYSQMNAESASNSAGIASNATSGPFGTSGASGASGGPGAAKMADSAAKSQISSVSLTGDESLSDLIAERTKVVDQLNNEKVNKTKVESSEEYIAAANALENAETNYNDELEKLDENADGIEGDIAKAKNDLDETENSISDVEREISNTTTNIDNLTNNRNSLESTLESLVRPNPDDPGYAQAIDEYESQKAQLQSDIENTNEALAQAQVQLEQQQANLSVLEDQKAQQYETLNSLLEQEGASELQNNQALQAAKQAYEQAKTAMDTVKAKVTEETEANIARLTENLDAINNAIQEKKQTENKHTEDEDAEKNLDGSLAGLPDYLKNTAKNKIKVGEDGKYYIEADRYDPDEIIDPETNTVEYEDNTKSSDINTVEKLMQNVYGYSYTSDEGKIILRALAAANPQLTGLNSDGYSDNDSLCISFAQGDQIQLVDASKILALLDNGVTVDQLKEEEYWKENNSVEQYYATAPDEIQPEEEEVLSDEEIEKIANDLAGKDGVVASDAWHNTDFSELSPASIAKIAQKYNEISDGNDFMDKVERMYKENPKQYDSVVQGLIAKAANDTDVYNLVKGYIDEAVTDGNKKFIGSMLDMQDENLGELQSVINQYGIDNFNRLFNLSDELKQGEIENYKNQFAAVMDKLDIPDEIQAKIDELYNISIRLESSEEVDDIQQIVDLFDEFENMDDEPFSMLIAGYEQQYENNPSITEIAKNYVYDCNEYDKIKEALNMENPPQECSIDEDTVDEYKEIILKGDITEIDFASIDINDLAYILNQCQDSMSKEEILEEAEDAFGKSENYSAFIERYEALSNLNSISPDEVPLGSNPIEGLGLDDINNTFVRETLDHIYESLDKINASQEDIEKGTLSQEYIQPIIDGVVTDMKKMLTENSGNNKTTTDEKLIILNSLKDIAGDVIPLDQVIADPDVKDMFNSVLDEISRNDEYPKQEIISLAQLYEEMSGGSKSFVDYLTEDMSTNSKEAEKFADTIINIYKNAKPEEIELLNSYFDINKIQELLKDQTETDKIKDLFKALIPNPDEVECDPKNKDNIDLFVEQYKNSSIEDILSLDLSNQTKLYLLLHKNEREVNGNEVTVSVDDLVEELRDIHSGPFGHGDEEDALRNILALFGIAPETEE